jgi:hypothetical protein
MRLQEPQRRHYVGQLQNLFFRDYFQNPRGYRWSGHFAVNQDRRLLSLWQAPVARY